MSPQNTIIGIDFGTTNSSAAVIQNNEVRLFSIDPYNTDPTTLKSSIYIDKNGEISLGQKAINNYLEKFEGVEIKSDYRITDELIDVVKNIEGDFSQEKMVEEYEINLPGRFIISPKRVMPNPFFTYTEAFGKIYTAQDLTELIFKDIKSQIDTQLGFETTKVNIGRPVQFSDIGDDKLAEERIREGAKRAGFKDINFIYEPVGATYNFALQTKNNPNYFSRKDHLNTLIFDFGGGTFDTTLAKISVNGDIDILGNEGVYIGGNRFNELIILHKFMQYFGRDITWGPTQLPIPEWIMDSASRWEMNNVLRKKENLELLESIRRQTNQSYQIENLIKLIKNNLGLSLFLLAEKAKLALSNIKYNTDLDLNWQKNNILIQEKISKNEFKSIVWPDIGRIVGTINRLLEKHHMDTESIDVVVKTGGSSKTFFINELLKNTFPTAIIHEADAFTAVAAGLAMVKF